MEGSTAIQSYRDLEVWKLGMDLAVSCYEVTRGFPRQEAFGMTSQIRRAAGSVPANIAEGYGRDGTGEYVRFLQIAQGSLKELETHLLLAVRVDLCSEEAAAPLLQTADRLGRMLGGLIRKVRASRRPRP